MSKIDQLKAKIMDIDQMSMCIKRWRLKNDKIVFTNGCYDILHKGHVEYLFESSVFGDRLIVGLNSDASVRRIKGNKRPVNNESARAITLAGLHCVDAVVFFDEDTPEQLINNLSPDVIFCFGWSSIIHKEIL